MPFRHDASDPMELRHLRYFVAVAECLSFTRAAARLRVAQPALSRQVRDLEDELGVDLLARSPRGVTLTAEGTWFLGESRRLLGLASDAADQVRALARGEFGELRIGYAPSPTVEILPPALSAFQTSAPRVQLVLQDLTSNEIADRIRDGTLDLGIMVRPTEEIAVGLAYEFLARYPFCVAVPPRHPFARRRNVPIAEVAREPLVTLRRREYTDFHRLVLAVFDGVAPGPRITTECDSSGSLFAEVQSGRGVTLLPTVYRHSVGDRLKLRPLCPAPAVALEIVACHAARGDLAPAAEKFLRQLLRQRTGTTSPG